MSVLMSIGVLEARRGGQIPWSWSFRWCELSNLDVGNPMREQCLLLAIKPPRQP